MKLGKLIETQNVLFFQSGYLPHTIKASNKKKKMLGQLRHKAAFLFVSSRRKSQMCV